jgi:pimeloyl-ACP methyl ester carboxylesterase
MRRNMYTVSQPQQSTPWLHREGLINGIRLHWVEARPRSSPKNSSSNKVAPLVVLLHGFPVFWYSWRHQITALALAGYRVVAPDLRGSNLTEKPVAGYDLNTLSQDIAELIATLTVDTEKAFLVGQDWGGVIAWAVAARFPELVHKLVVVDSNPTLCTLDNMSFRQRCKSWHMLFFQIPVLPELIFGCNRAWMLAHCFLRRRSSTCTCTYNTTKTDEGPSSSDFDDSTLELYRDAMSQPGALSRMLQYFRTIQISTKQSRTYPPVRVPVLILSGDEQQDSYTFLGGREAMDEVALQEYVEAPVERIALDCGHWMQQELPEEVNRHLILFFSKQHRPQKLPPEQLPPPATTAGVASEICQGR